MKIFVSWSGTLSKNIAEILRQWIPAVVQAAKPYYSPDDITKGARWTTEIAKELEESSIGIICLTNDNLEAPWIMFEAGALSKKMDKSKVCPILFGPDPADIQGPLIQFQASKFEKEEIKKVIRMINLELGEHGLAANVFDEVFEMWWPRLKEKVENELKAPKKHEKGKSRSERELLEEILDLSRAMSLASERGQIRSGIEPGAIVELIDKINRVLIGIDRGEPTGLIFAKMYDLRRPLDYIVRMSGIPQSILKEFDLIFEHNVKLNDKRKSKNRLFASQNLEDFPVDTNEIKIEKI